MHHMRTQQVAAATILGMRSTMTSLTAHTASSAPTCRKSAVAIGAILLLIEIPGVHSRSHAATFEQVSFEAHRSEAADGSVPDPTGTTSCPYSSVQQALPWPGRDIRRRNTRILTKTYERRRHNERNRRA